MYTGFAQRAGRQNGLTKRALSTAQVEALTKCTLIKQSKSSQNQHFYMLCVTWGGGVANNLHDASHQPHLTESFLILCCTSCELTEGSSRRYCIFTSLIGGHRQRPGILRSRKRAESGEMCEI
jgi:hypothetical protein